MECCDHGVPLDDFCQECFDWAFDEGFFDCG